MFWNVKAKMRKLVARVEGTRGKNKERKPHTSGMAVEGFMGPI
jgi:hypothetical protein